MKNKNVNPVTIQVYSEQEYNNIEGQDLMANGNNEDLYALQNAANKYFIGDTSPFVIILTNTSDGVISDVAFLNAAESIGAENNGVTAGVTPTSGYAGKSYKSILNLLLTGDWEFNSFYIYASTNNQATQSISFITDNQRGDFSGTTLMPDILISQTMSGVAYCEKSVKVGKFTKAVLASIEAKATYRIKMYIGERTTQSGVVLQSPIPTFSQQIAQRQR